MDSWSLLDEVDVMRIWPAEHKKNVESSKWQERKEALEALADLIAKHPRLSTDTLVIYGEIMDQLKKIVSRDSNVNVLSAALRVLTGLAEGLRDKFAIYISMIWPVLVEKGKEKKAAVREPLAACLEAVAATTQLERLSKDLAATMAKPSPPCKQLLNQLVFTLLKKEPSPPMAFLKEMLPVLVKHASDPDKDVREAACEALGGARRLMGGALDTFTAPIAGEQSKMDKIAEACDRATTEAATWAAERAAAMGGVAGGGGGGGGEGDDGGAGECGEGASSSSGGGAPAALDPWQILDPVDAFGQLDKAWDALAESKQWKERVEACESLERVLEKNQRLCIGDTTGQRMAVLIKMLEKDVNVNAAAGCAKCIGMVALGLRGEFERYINKAMSAGLEKLKEKKATLREPLLKCLDAMATTASLSVYVDEVCAALAKTNPAVRAQTALLLSRILTQHSAATLPVEAVKQLAPVMSKLTSDADKDVREASFAAWGAVARVLGPAANSLMAAEVADDKIKTDKIEEYRAKFVEEKGSGASPEMIRLHGKGGGGGGGGGSAPSRPAPAASARPASAAKPAAARPAPRPAPARAAAAAVKPAPRPVAVRPAVRPSPAPAPSRVTPRVSAPPARPPPTARVAPAVRVVSATASKPATPAARAPAARATSAVVPNVRAAPASVGRSTAPRPNIVPMRAQGIKPRIIPAGSSLAAATSSAPVSSVQATTPTRRSMDPAIVGGEMRRAASRDLINGAPTEQQVAEKRRFGFTAGRASSSLVSRPAGLAAAQASLARAGSNSGLCALAPPTRISRPPSVTGLNASSTSRIPAPGASRIPAPPVKKLQVE